MFIVHWLKINVAWDSEYLSGCFNVCNWIIFRDFLRVPFRAAAQIVLSGSVAGLVITALSSEALYSLLDCWS